ncbi:MAG: CPBP family intramembrane metalloprotease [Ruminococcus sp.]|nr:CPBP family intramembrane metalloprotease [Ruminococcus sp.]
MNNSKNAKLDRLRYLLPVRSIIFFLIFIIGSYSVGNDVSGISNWWSVAASSVNIILILFLVLVSRKAGSNYCELINLKRGSASIKKIAAIAAAFIVVGMAGMYLAGFICYGKLPYMSPMLIAPIPVGLAAVNFIILPVSTALAEEGLYLGCGVERFRNKYAAILIPAFFFALQHSFIPTLFDMKYVVYRFLSFLPLTLAICWYYRKNRDPIPVIAGHIILDIATSSMILMTSVSPSLYDKMREM